MHSDGALAFRDLWEAPIPEAIGLVEALGYILEETAEIRRVEAERVASTRRRR